MRNLLAAAGLVGALAATLTSCFTPFACTEMGCSGSLTLTLTADGAPVDLYSGTVTVGERVYDVDCTGATSPSPEITCGVGELSIRLDGEGAADDEVAWQLEGWDAEGGPPSMAANDATTPAWSEWEPNGKGCPPTCRSAEVAVVLDVLDGGR